MPKKHTTRREFSMTRPIMYQGEYYPSADSLITDGNGRKTKGRIFADANGQYYTLDGNGNIMEAMPVNNLDEVTVTAQNKQVLPSLFDSYLTISNDNTMVKNAPHRKYNSHLEENALKGAREHALWDKEHPNLSSWRDAATAVPFAIAGTPIVLGGGQGLLGITAGQTIRNGLTTLMENPYVAGTNEAIGLGFAGKGAYDVTQGKFTPETAMDLAGGAGLMFKGFDFLKNFARGRRTARGISEVTPTESDWIAPGVNDASSMRAEENINALRNRESNLIGFMPESHNVPRPTGGNDEFQGLFGYSMEEDAARASQAARENNVPSRLMDDYDAMVANARVQGANDPAMQGLNNMASRASSTEELPFFADGRPNPNYQYPFQTVESNNFGSTPFQGGNPLDDLISNEELQRGAASYNPSTRILFRSRDTKAGETPYTEEEINTLVDEYGRLKRGVKFDDADEVYTGGHGEFFNPQWHPEQDETWILRQHLANTDPNNRYNGAFELKQIMKDNPGGRSGVLIKTHTGDTSMDSTPLAYVMATRFAKNFKPLNGRLERVGSNSYGYNTAFKSGKDIDALNARAKAILDADPNYKAKLLRDEKGNMTAYELTDENGTFQIPLNSRQEVLDTMNARLHKFNKHYGTSYKDIEPQKNLNGEYYNPDSPYPWNFGESFDLPNIYGIAYKQGGKIKRRLLTEL